MKKAGFGKNQNQNQRYEARVGFPGAKFGNPSYKVGSFSLYIYFMYVDIFCANLACGMRFFIFNPLNPPYQGDL